MNPPAIFHLPNSRALSTIGKGTLYSISTALCILLQCETFSQSLEASSENPASPRSVKVEPLPIPLRTLSNSDQNHAIQAHENPYSKWLFQAGEQIVSLTPDRIESPTGSAQYKQWKAENEWKNPNLANALLLQAALFALKDSPWHGSPALLASIDAFFRRLEVRGYDNRWYHLESGMGDRNIDRFTLVPLMEAFMLTRGSLDPALQTSVFERIKGALDIQLREYGRDGKPVKRLYPNMDAYYCLAMLLGANLIGDPKYQAEFSRYLDALETAQFEDGGWTYIAGMNESPGYHDIVVILMGRIFDLSKSEKALSQLKRSIPYYPITMSPGGIMENHTDCWWKHPENRLTSYGPDIVSSLTGDAQNRWLANETRADTGMAFDPVLNPDGPKMATYKGVFLYYASLLWKEVPSEPVPANRVFYDANIQGPRGHMDGWSWAATGRFGSDTVVGATAHTGADEDRESMMAVTPGIPYYPPDRKPGVHANDRWDLATIPEGTRGITRIEGTKATFEVNYQLACGHAFWGAPAYPFQWRCDQSWEMDGKRMVGHIKLTSLSQQSSPAPTVTIRFGKGHRLKAEKDGSFSFGRFKLSVKSEDFPKHLQRESSIMLSKTAKDADELVFFPEVGLGNAIACHSNQEFNFQVTVEFEGKADR